MIPGGADNGAGSLLHQGQHSAPEHRLAVTACGRRMLRIRSRLKRQL